MENLFAIVIVIFSVVIHEVSHGIAAYSMGDETAKRAGRLTLNPFPHLDFFGSFVLPVVLYLTTGFTIGYAKPVPYDPYNLNDPKYGPAKVAFAGPLANIILAILFGIAYRVLVGTATAPGMLSILETIILINLSLAFFNLVPIPPLDGHWLLMTFLPGARALKQFLYQYSMLLLFFFIIFIFPRIFFIVIEAFRLITGT